FLVGVAVTQLLLRRADHPQTPTQDLLTTPPLPLGLLHRAAQAPPGVGPQALLGLRADTGRKEREEAFDELFRLGESGFDQIREIPGGAEQGGCLRRKRR